MRNRHWSHLKFKLFILASSPITCNLQGISAWSLLILWGCIGNIYEVFFDVILPRLSQWWNNIRILLLLACDSRTKRWDASAHSIWDRSWNLHLDLIVCFWVIIPLFWNCLKLFGFKLSLLAHVGFCLNQVINKSLLMVWKVVFCIFRLNRARKHIPFVVPNLLLLSYLVALDCLVYITLVLFFDWDSLLEHPKMVVDTSNIVKGNILSCRISFLFWISALFLSMIDVTYRVISNWRSVLLNDLLCRYHRL